MQYTAVFEFDDDDEPTISKKDSWLGGKLVSVQFNNAFKEIDDVIERLEELEQLYQRIS